MSKFRPDWRFVGLLLIIGFIVGFIVGSKPLSSFIILVSVMVVTVYPITLFEIRLPHFKKIGISFRNLLTINTTEAGAFCIALVAGYLAYVFFA